MDQLDLTIRLADFTFHGGDYPGETGFTVASWSGWTGGAGSRRERSARPGQHGAHRTPSYRPDRMFTFRGRYHGSSVADVAHMGDALTGFEGRPARVTVSWDDTRWADVEVDQVRFEPDGAFPWADYQMELWMPDPFKYGQTQQFTTSTDEIVTMHHRGNTEAVPRFVVTGSFPSGYELHAGGRVVKVGATTGTVTDVVDFRTGTVIRNGALQPRLLQLVQFWRVPGGMNLSWRLGRLGGTGTATAYVTDTYV